MPVLLRAHLSGRGNSPMRFIPQTSRSRVAALGAALACLLPHPAAIAFEFDDVARLARELAAAPPRKTDSGLPKELRSLDYGQYRAIRFRPERFHWRRAGLPFELAFFHRGWRYGEAVKINEVAADGVREIRFDPEAFDYGPNKIDPKRMQGLGFAGFRVHYPVNTPDYKDEVLVFLGASYFRALGKGQRHGLSGRGLALDTAVAAGEEFPRFVEFWIERPAPGARELTIYGLLESRRATGAYRFVLRPGVDTALEVKARLFLREGVAKLGLAPLTSMYFFGENQRSAAEDYRPEVHDSDGLSIRSASGEWLWRPLVNPRRLLVTSFALANPVGFGLMQRDRSFASYQELDTRFDLRPSLWVEPKGKWGEGRVELVLIPTPDDTNDNVVAYWVPANPPPPRQPYDLEYRLLWQKDAETRPALARVMQTRRGELQPRKPDGSVALAVDFAGRALKKRSAGVKPEAMLWIDANGQVLERGLHRNEVTGGWRVTLRVRRVDEKKPVEIRAYLKGGNETLSETWSYILPPD